MAPRSVPPGPPARWSRTGASALRPLMSRACSCPPEGHAGELGDGARDLSAVRSHHGGRTGRAQEQRPEPDDADREQRHHDPAHDTQRPHACAMAPRCELHAHQAAQRQRQQRQHERQPTTDDEGDDAVGGAQLDGIDGGTLRAHAADLEGDHESDRPQQHGPARARDGAEDQAQEPAARDPPQGLGRGRRPPRREPGGDQAGRQRDADRHYQAQASVSQDRRGPPRPSISSRPRQCRVACCRPHLGSPFSCRAGGP